ncbi:MAG TPA: CHRD domain-containing protein, partial [Usitatibacter sp.]|nr:CHRD domain-containing protein [Usitatibacter sp.]
MHLNRRLALGIGSTGIAMILAACGGGSGGPNGPVVGTTKTVTLNGAQVAPTGLATASSGQGSLTVDSGGRMGGSITTFGITGTSAHVHDAAVGSTGPVIIELTQTSANTWTVPDVAFLTDPQIESFKNGTFYVDVHTAANPNGEIRGQVGRMVFFATLTGTQEVPATGSAATGFGRWVYDPETKTISGTETVTGMSATVSHFHAGAVGVVAGVAIPFTGGPTTWTLAPTVLTDAQANALLNAGFYANAHSVAFPGGEIRGQVYQPTKCTTLTGAQETPPNSSAATGSSCVGVNPANKAVAGRIETQGITAILAH